MHDFLIKTIEQIISLDEKDKDFIISHFKLMEVKKGDFFLKEGEPNLLLGFIVKGLVRIFINKGIDDEATIDFSKEGEFITPN
ncbi:MAG: hypothetical protein IPI52_06690 [Bacteroidetes bacterium]|nr:hypothetical protein [Bacteroidota bacterium]